MVSHRDTREDKLYTMAAKACTANKQQCAVFYNQTPNAMLNRQLQLPQQPR